MTSYFFTLLFILISLPCAFASLPGSRGGGGSSSSKGFYFSVAAKGGLGKGGSAGNDLMESRDFYVYGAETTLGITMGGILLGASAEYNVWSQKTEPKEVDNTNLSGKQLSISPTVGFAFGRFLLQARPYLYSKMTMDKKSVDGEKVEYSAPELPSYNAQLVYSLGKSYIGVEYSNIVYKKRSTGGEEKTLSSDDKMSFSSFGVVYGYKF